VLKVPLNQVIGSML